MEALMGVRRSRLRPTMPIPGSPWRKSRAVGHSTCRTSATSGTSWTVREPPWGCFVTLEPAPARSRADAKTAGRVHVAGHAYDRLHLWSMADYFDGRWPTLPVMTDPYSGRPLNQPGLF